MTARAAVGRVRAEYLVPREHPAPGAVRRRLDRVAAAAVEAGVRRAVEAAAGDDRVWVIRRLDLGVVLNPAADDPAVTGVWADRVAAALTRVFVAGPDGDNVLVFPTRAALVARYAADRAAGRPGAWWAAEFDGLAALPPGAAVREALARDAPRAAAVVRELARDGALEAVLACLTARDADDAWRAVRGAAAAPTPEAVEAALAAWPRAGVRPTTGGIAAPSNRLRLFAATAAVAADDALAAGVEVVLAAAAGPGDPAADGRGVSVPPALAARVAAVVGPTRAGDAVVGPRLVPTAFAGLFLAWAAGAAAGLTAVGGAAFRYLVALKVLGGARAAEAWLDPLPPLAAGLDGPPRDWPTAADRPALLRDLVRALARARQVCGRVTADRVAGGAVLLRDADSGAWLCAAPSADEGLTLVAEATGRPCELVAGPAADVDAELAYFALAGRPLPPGVGADADLAATLAARAVVRAFAARLCGFAASSPEHLARNFLAAPGTVRVADGVVDVRVRPPPLHVVLRLAGRDADAFTLPDGRPARVALDPD